MPFKFGVDSNGNYGYIKDGADTVTPFLTRTGNATTSQVLSGYTFSNASSSGLTGTMTNNSSGYSTIASNRMGWDSSNHLWCYIPANAYYSSSYWLQLRNSDVASKIGLTAAKIVRGNTILGITGSASAIPTNYKVISGELKSYTETASLSGFEVGRIAIIDGYSANNVSISGLTVIKTINAMLAQYPIELIIGTVTNSTITLNKPGTIFYTESYGYLY